MMSAFLISAATATSPRWNDLAAKEPERLAELVRLWWREAERHNVLPLDDRFGLRFAENAARFHAARTRISEYRLSIDGEAAGLLQTPLGFHNLISWSGLDIGRDRGSPVSHYAAPFEFTGRLLRVTVIMHDDQKLDGDGVGHAAMARQ